MNVRPLFTREQEACTHTQLTHTQNELRSFHISESHYSMGRGYFGKKNIKTLSLEFGNEIFKT